MNHETNAVKNQKELVSRLKERIRTQVENHQKKKKRIERTLIVFSGLMMIFPFGQLAYNELSTAKGNSIIEETIRNIAVKSHPKDTTIRSEVGPWRSLASTYTKSYTYTPLHATWSSWRYHVVFNETEHFELSVFEGKNTRHIQISPFTPSDTP